MAAAALAAKMRGADAGQIKDAGAGLPFTGGLIGQHQNDGTRANHAEAGERSPVEGAGVPAGSLRLHWPEAALRAGTAFSRRSRNQRPPRHEPCADDLGKGVHDHQHSFLGAPHACQRGLHRHAGRGYGPGAQSLNLSPDMRSLETEPQPLCSVCPTLSPRPQGAQASAQFTLGVVTIKYGRMGLEESGIKEF